jgi:hypothetical protein
LSLLCCIVTTFTIVEKPVFTPFLSKANEVVTDT